MKYIKDPEHMALSVIPTNLSQKEADEIADFIERCKADSTNTTVTFKVEVKKGQDLDFLTNLLQRLNLKWTVTER
jgi:hypothetical protein